MRLRDHPIPSLKAREVSEKPTPAPEVQRVKKIPHPLTIGRPLSPVETLYGSSPTAAKENSISSVSHQLPYHDELTPPTTAVNTPLAAAPDDPVSVSNNPDISLEENLKCQSERGPSSHCHSPETFGSAIWVYECLIPPERVALGISIWESRHGIDKTINDDNEPHHDHESIPRDAVYILLAELLMFDPYGSVMFFATKSEAGDFDLKIGFYWSYAKTSDTCIYAIQEWCDNETTCGNPILQKSEAIRPQFDTRFKKVYSKMSKACDAEIERQKTGPKLRNLYGPNRRRPFRRRAAVLDQ